MSDPVAVRLASRLRPRPPAASAAPGGAGPRSWRPAWSVPAAIRAGRATVVVPGLFAICLKVIGDPQMTLFAVFGGFGGLVLTSFGGARRDKAVAYLGLAVVGSVALVIGTLVSGTIWLAAVVTIPVAFAIFFAGVTGPNLASGVTAALLAYVLPVATAAPASAIGSRLEGWWLAMAAATVAVLLVSPKSPGDKLRASAAASARAMARQLTHSVAGSATQEDWEAVLAAKHRLLNDFGSTPLRPTGLATADQGLANVVELLEWCSGLVADALDGQHDFSHAAAADAELLSAAAEVLAAVAGLLDGQDAIPDLGRLEEARRASAAHQRNLSGEPDRVRASVAHAAHAQVIAVAARAVVADAIIAARRADPDLIAAERRRWSGQQAAAPASRLPALATDTRYLARHASIRSVWFRNSLRGAVALAAAVAVADLTGVQHGFWVVLGTLSVLRTTAAATGSTALRAVGGTVIGFALGAALVLAIGTGPTALWVALPVAVLVAGYAPGTAPFAVGQAAFTITVVVIFNLLVPVGWQVGLLRIEDVALGCAVSVVVGLLFWPRGAGGIVGTDLADAFRRAAAYLTEAVDWALGVRTTPPDTAVAAISASIRLDEALRAYLTEQGVKRMAKEDLWRLVLGTTRLRLTAYSVASLHDPAGFAAPAAGNGSTADGTRSGFQHLTRQLVGFYEQVADQLSGSARGAVQPARVPDLAGPDLPAGVACADNTPPDYQPDLLWVGEYLYHLGTNAQSVSGPAARAAMLRQLPWWR
ncbi:MAG TPA: FUSC family protein [Streptosporangiaceae bacterium]|nr:FUSC family protein [Streptosporangiaceae bacterium]